MKIQNIQLQEEGNFILLTADCKIRHIGTDRVYFKFEKKHRDFILADASPFAAALLVPSMKMGQNLIIEGAISQKLYEGMQGVMKLMTSWNIGLKTISIEASEMKVDDETETEKNASFFSGGVDSFYTYLKHKEQGGKIDYLILANGFDISLDNPKLWEQTCGTMDDISRSENIEIIKVESNIRDLIEPVAIWDYTHGGCLAAIGLALRKSMKTIYIPSSLAFGQLLPWGSNPYLDPLWSTESLSFCHDGAETKRVDKVKFIAQSPLALKNLRVCFINAKDKFNCGTCDKCLRTMINLRIAGKLEESETFPHTINLDLVKRLTVSGKQNAILHEENLRGLEQLGIDKDLQTELRRILSEFHRPKFNSRKTLKKMRYYIMEAINEFRQIDYFYNQDRIHKSKLFYQKKARKGLSAFKAKKKVGSGESIYAQKLP